MAGHRNFGRLGLRAPLLTPPDDVPFSTRRFVRIAATGEFTFLPFILAEQLQESGADVLVQATSRSPVKIGGAIGQGLCFRDNYGSGVPNYLYNVDRAEPRETWICHETPLGSIDPALVDALGARLVGWAA